MAVQIGGNIPANQYVTASQMAASKNQAAQQTADESEKKKVERSRPVHNVFSEMLKKQDEAEQFSIEGMPPEIAKMDFDQALSFLLDQVTMAGEELKKSPYGDTFPKYRQKIAQFFRFVEKKAYGIDEIQVRRSVRNPNPKKKYIIKVVDEKLDQLARDILYDQADQLKLLQKVNEINGLIVDLIS
ncbi:MAG: YaaR family protein [Treponema sp.]|nr:YaaR family protein [Candidatus Treponema caballi]